MCVVRATTHRDEPRLQPQTPKRHCMKRLLLLSIVKVRGGSIIAMRDNVEAFVPLLPGCLHHLARKSANKTRCTKNSTLLLPPRTTVLCSVIRRKRSVAMMGGTTGVLHQNRVHLLFLQDTPHPLAEETPLHL